MTLASELDRAWRTMEAGDASAGLLRSLADFGVPGKRMMLAIEEGCRELLFPTSEDLLVTDVNRTRGVQITVRTYVNEGSTNRYLVLRCAKPEFQGVFRRFAGAVIEQISTATDPARAALDAIRGWQEMFDRAGAKTEAMLSGIYGELHELSGLVKRRPAAYLTWTGPDARPQDFINGTHALEVKTRRKLASDVEIHGVEQLWARPYERLVLVVKHIVTDPAGERIADIVASLVEHGVPPIALAERLEAFDLDEQQLAALEPRFTHRSSRYFIVTDRAPALTPDLLRSPLPAAVSRVKYWVSLDASGFEEMSPAALETFLARMASA
jgi:hypothetical protein